MNTTPNMEELKTAWRAAKAAEDTANAERLAIEAAIVALMPSKLEGSVTDAGVSGALTAAVPSAATLATSARGTSVVSTGMSTFGRPATSHAVDRSTARRVARTHSAPRQAAHAS